MKTWELLCIISSSLVVGLFSGPWSVLSRNFKSFHPALFLGIAKHMCETMPPAVTVLMPISVLSMIPILIGSNRWNTLAFGFNAAAFVLNLSSVVIVVTFEVPLLDEIAAWKSSSVPENWEARRDLWITAHKGRVFAGIASLLCVIVAATL